MWLLQFDHTVTFGLYRGAHISAGYQQFLYSLATYFIYLVPILLLFLFFRSYRDRINSAKIFLTAILSWQVLSTFLGHWLYNSYGFRERPFAELGISELFFERPQKAFPSDHAAVLFAVMLAFFAYKYPKLGWLFLIGGILSSIGRVAIGFHWAGDILGGWLIGLVAFLIVRYFDRPLTVFFDRLFQFLHLRRRTDAI